MHNTAKNLAALRAKMQDKGLEACYISSYDPYLNEYVPQDDCHRYHFSGFTGSVAELLVPLEGAAVLFVDGRYQQQAVQEVDPVLVKVESRAFLPQLEGALIETLKKLGLSKIGLEPERTTLSFYQQLEADFELVALETGELEQEILSPANYKKGEILPLEKNWSGASTSEKLQRLLGEGQAVWVNALDSIAWLANCRCSQMPYQATFRAKALATREKLFICPHQGLTLSASLKDDPAIEWVPSQHHSSFAAYVMAEKLVSEQMVLSYDPGTIPAYDYQQFEGRLKLVSEVGKVLSLQCQKSAEEITAFEESFDKSDQAIHATLNWVYQQVDGGQSISEMDFYNKTNENYKKLGAYDLSFKTIAAFGANSSIVHYGDPKGDLFLAPQQLALLDSGGLFDYGMATDTTRTIFSGGTPTAIQKEIYTLTLKSLLNMLNHEFDSGTLGKELDVLARKNIKEKGHNYSHGTGHGVGINVHEGGYKISPDSEVPILAGRVGSIEPGIYLEGIGGVRLEILVVVEEVPEKNNRLRFRSLTYIGFDHRLIDKDFLNQDDLILLDNYEQLCDQRGRAFKQFWDAGI
ncbi:MAG: M24 family metallopeptidase [Halobacteriovoraceae bacterium]|nr:M24 family metallopeptidase [Halobacteriovoraceae bacterium]